MLGCHSALSLSTVTVWALSGDSTTCCNNQQANRWSQPKQLTVQAGHRAAGHLCGPSTVRRTPLVLRVVRHVCIADVRWGTTLQVPAVADRVGVRSGSLRICTVNVLCRCSFG